MKNFFSSLLAVLIGFSLVSIIGIAIVVAIVAASSEEKPVEIKDNSILLLQLSGPIADRGKEQPFKIPEISQFGPKEKIGLNDIIKVLSKAQDDDKIKGVVLNIKGMQAGAATIKEIRDALKEFKKESGKFIYSFNHSYSQSNYYLSSVADSMFLNPEGDMEIKGLSYKVTFFKDALAKLGVEPQIIRHGTFKAAVEPFMLTEMSDANKEQSSSFIGTIWGMMTDDIAESRGISKEKLNTIADEMLVYSAESAVQHKLVDKLLYRDEFVAKLMALTDKEKEEDLKLVGLGKYKKSIKRTAKERRKEKIAIVYGAGGIQMGKGNEEVITSEDFSKAIRDARKDSTIKAVVLRINSPGGSALASDIIWREIELLKKEKPVVVSMGDLAASGGYYIACNSDYILAQPSTLTGSIGVFGLMFSGEKLLEKKLGINTDGVQTNKHSDIGTFTRSLADEERAVIKRAIEDIYDTFTGHVAKGRKMSQEEVFKIGEGRVWSGVDAKRIGLVDELGGLHRALEVAKEKAELDDYRVVELPKEKDPFQEFLENMQTKVENSVLERRLGQSYKYFDRLEKVQKMEGVQARIPFFMDLE